MRTSQYKWSRDFGWAPDLGSQEIQGEHIVFAFGARPLLQGGNLVAELRDSFKDVPIVGCSTSGEILGDEVIDDSLVVTVVEFDHTQVRSAYAKIDETKTSDAVGC